MEAMFHSQYLDGINTELLKLNAGQTLQPKELIQKY